MIEQAIIQKDSEIALSFIIINQDGDFVSGLNLGDFTIKIYDPNGIDQYSTLSESVEELQSGLYRIKFTPNQSGNWQIFLSQATYLTQGISTSINVNEDQTHLESILGLAQENQYCDEFVFDSNNNLTSARMRIYSDAASVSTTSNILATYIITGTYVGNITTFLSQKQ